MPESAARVFARLSTGEPATNTKVLMDKAVVLGGSVAGLLAARVLSDHARSVVIVERDELPADAAFRASTPHDGHLHTLMHGGRRQLDRLFPGFTEQAQAEGALLCAPDEVCAFADGVPKISDGEMSILSSSRPFLESLVRRRTLELPNVKVLVCRARELVFAGDRVTGVRCGTGNDEWVEEADLVVDAMGRASKLSEWLEQAGWEAPQMRRMSVRINYATAYFRRTQDRPDYYAALAYWNPTAEVPEVASGAINAIEGDRWLITLASYGHQKPGRTVEEFRRLCREKLPPVFGAACSGEHLGEIRTYHQAESRRRDFHRLRRFPARLLSIGDAVASFNPIYGQGMSSASLQASALSEYLRSDVDLDRPALDFFARQRVVIDAAWQISTAADLARPDVDGPYPRGYRVSQWFANKIVDASVTDQRTAARFNSVTYMRNHPSVLMAPGTLLRALRISRKAKAAGSA